MIKETSRSSNNFQRHKGEIEGSTITEPVAGERLVLEAWRLAF